MTENNSLRLLVFKQKSVCRAQEDQGSVKSTQTEQPVVQSLNREINTKESTQVHSTLLLYL